MQRAHDLPPFILTLDILRDWSLLVLILSDVDEGNDPVDWDNSRAMSRRVLRSVILA